MICFRIQERMNEMNTAVELMRKEQQRKIENYRVLNKTAVRGKILFTGSSLMEMFPVEEFLQEEGSDQIIYNRGIGGFVTDDMLRNMNEQIFDLEPSAIFINIGTNDIGDSSRTFPEVLSHMLRNYEEILRQISERLPDTKVFTMAYYPVCSTGKENDPALINRNNQNLPATNKAVKELAEKMGYCFIDVNDGLTDEQGMLKESLTIDGIHMYPEGYRIVWENLKPYLYALR